MMPSTPTSPTLPPPSPCSPNTTSPGQHLRRLVEPVPQLVATSAMQQIDSILSPVHEESPAVNGSDSNGSICRRNSLSSPVSSPTQTWSFALARTGDQRVDEFRFQPAGICEDGRQSRMAMRSSRMTLPLRVNTTWTGMRRTASGADLSRTQMMTMPMASSGDDRVPSSPFSDTTTLVDWTSPTSSPRRPRTTAPAAAATHRTDLANRSTSTSTYRTPSKRQLVRARMPSPIGTATTATAGSSPSPPRSSRSPIRKKLCSSRRGGAAHVRCRLPPPPKYHVVVRPSGTEEYSPTTLRNRIQYMHSVKHLRAPLVPLISVSSGLAHPVFPTTLLQYHLLTHEQLDDLARWYHQVDPPVDETFMYPAWIPAWTSLDSESADANGNAILSGPDSDAENNNTTTTVSGVDLETKRRRFGRFIGLRGCDSPTTATADGNAERPEELARRMEREWRRALRRAEEEEMAWEKTWRGRW
ncbi:hypothetical protein HRR83_008129 [Exophiala dermatitidis]|uniref:Uncharacterized protein n=2 Tax=Exophiala dermatitidis TaxID=5970 RepID=H6BT43_EXODN|nr:uncharacterized protein HMPREF1120_02463 [Exophiala dermatitidis NIH/UT8656]KAJ4505050.1 hypothetical protein HRR74_008878 [Exophiala dermatitidis]EHY54293.1 hypothetical protein HMPREF1120_02463 [Exophiala dermatitidis NIH/UT8656]KAJ4513559.1 hypothetical protein HRR73_005717 [Exophiala dermatitidis]KAJ4535663.1 hypothetical protein HRR77_007611 [Exophiala dermatitidis]KAJ4544524.1 hypothetical protein HRR76_002580 [Exophiala dermatitidis]